MTSLLLPGWGVPTSSYENLLPDVKTLNLGFFSGETIDLTKTPPRLQSEGKDLVLIGHSLGALLAIQASLLLDDVKALVLISGFARFAEDADYPGQSIKPMKAMRLQLKLGPRGLLRKFHEAMTHPEALTIPLPEMIDSAALSRGLDVLINYDYRKQLDEIRIPVLILHGAQDQIAAPAIAEEMAKRLPNARLEMIEGAGHALPLTHRETCKTLINEFLDGLE